jgi:hypothetical protein
VLHGGEPGNEIQSPMAQVILGGLLTSTFLNLVVVPALYERWGGSGSEESMQLAPTINQASGESSSGRFEAEATDRASTRN